MKKVLFLFLLMTATLPSFAQFEPSVQAYYDFSVDDYSNKTYGLDIIGNYRFSKQFKAGIGVGIAGGDWLYYESYENNRLAHGSDESRDQVTLLPIFANAQYNFIDKGITPYINLRGGYTVSLQSNIDNPGLMLSPSFGVSFPITRGAVYLQVGYKAQWFKSDFFSITDYRPGHPETMSYSETESKCSSQIEVSVGYSF